MQNRAQSAKTGETARLRARRYYGRRRWRVSLASIRADAQTRRRAGDVIGDDRQGSVAATVSTISHPRPGNSTSHWLVHLELHRNAASPPPARQCTAATCRPTRPTRAIGTLPNADATQDGISQPLGKLPASCRFLRLRRLTSQPFWPGWSTMQFAMAGRTRALFSGGGKGGEKRRKEAKRRRKETDCEIVRGHDAEKSLLGGIYTGVVLRMVSSGLLYLYFFAFIIFCLFGPASLDPGFCVVISASNCTTSWEGTAITSQRHAFLF